MTGERDRVTTLSGAAIDSFTQGRYASYVTLSSYFGWMLMPGVVILVLDGLARWLLRCMIIGHATPGRAMIAGFTILVGLMWLPAHAGLVALARRRGVPARGRVWWVWRAVLIGGAGAFAASTLGSGDRFCG